MSDQLEQAEFLFAGKVRNEIQAISQKAKEVVDAQVRLMVLRSSGNVNDELGNSPRTRNLNKDIQVLTDQLRAQLPTLAQIMGEEMRLYIPRAQSVREESVD